MPKMPTLTAEYPDDTFELLSSNQEELNDPFSDATLNSDQLEVVREEQKRQLQMLQDLQNEANKLRTNDPRVLRLKTNSNIVKDQLTNGQRTRAQLKNIRDGIVKYKRLIEDMIEKQRLLREEQVKTISADIQTEINLAKSFNFPNLLTEMQELEKESQRLGQLYMKLVQDEKIIQDHTKDLSPMQMEEFKKNYQSFKMLYESFVKLEKQIYSQFVRSEKAVPMLPSLPAEPVQTMLEPASSGKRRRRKSRNRKRRSGKKAKKSHKKM